MHAKVFDVCTRTLSSAFRGMEEVHDLKCVHPIRAQFLFAEHNFLDLYTSVYCSWATVHTSACAVSGRGRPVCQTVKPMHHQLHEKPLQH